MNQENAEMNRVFVIKDVHEVELGTPAQRGECLEWYGDGPLCVIDHKQVIKRKAEPPTFSLVKQLSEISPTFIVPREAVIGPFTEEEAAKLFMIMHASETVVLLNPATRETRAVPRVEFRDQTGIVFAEVEWALATFENNRWKKYSY